MTFRDVFVYIWPLKDLTPPPSPWVAKYIQTWSLPFFASFRLFFFHFCSTCICPVPFLPVPFSSAVFLCFFPSLHLFGSTNEVVHSTPFLLICLDLGSLFIVINTDTPFTEAYFIRPLWFSCVGDRPSRWISYSHLTTHSVCKRAAERADCSLCSLSRCFTRLWVSFFFNSPLVSCTLHSLMFLFLRLLSLSPRYYFSILSSWNTHSLYPNLLYPNASDLSFLGSDQFDLRWVSNYIIHFEFSIPLLSTVLISNVRNPVGLNCPLICYLPLCLSLTYCFIQL